MINRKASQFPNNGMMIFATVLSTAACFLYCSLSPASAQNSSTLQTPNYYTVANLLQLTVGLLAPNATTRFRTLMGFGQSVPAINIALARIASEHLIDNVNFTFVWYEGDCNQSAAAGETIQLMQWYDIDAMVGPPCTTGKIYT